MTNAREQLAGLVDRLRGFFDPRVHAIGDDLAAILATLPEPGVVSHQAVLAANALVLKTPLPVMVYGQVQEMLEAALPYLAPAAPAGEVACERCGDSKQEFGYNGDGPYTCRHCPQPAPAAPPAQGFDVEMVAELIAADMEYDKALVAASVEPNRTKRERVHTARLRRTAALTAAVKELSRG